MSEAAAKRDRAALVALLARKLRARGVEQVEAWRRAEEACDADPTETRRLASSLARLERKRRTQPRRQDT